MSLTMTFYTLENEPQKYEVASVSCQVSKHADGWHAFHAVRLLGGWTNLDGSTYSRDTTVHATRQQAIRALRTRLEDEFGTVPAITQFRIERGLPIPFPADAAHPFRKVA